MWLKRQGLAKDLSSFICLINCNLLNGFKDEPNNPMIFPGTDLGYEHLCSEVVFFKHGTFLHYTYILKLDFSTDSNEIRSIIYFKCMVTARLASHSALTSWSTF